MYRKHERYRALEGGTKRLIQLPEVAASTITCHACNSYIKFYLPELFRNGCLKISSGSVERVVKVFSSR